MGEICWESTSREYGGAGVLYRHGLVAREGSESIRVTVIHECAVRWDVRFLFLEPKSKSKSISHGWQLVKLSVVGLTEPDHGSDLAEWSPRP